jgi:hypothetical protein
MPARAIWSARRPDTAGGWPDQPHEGEQQGALAGAVAAEYGECLTTVHVEVDAVQDLALAVPGA